MAEKWEPRKGWSWMDVDLGNGETEDVTYWPSDGQGGVTTDSTASDVGASVQCEVLGFTMTTVPDATSTVQLRDGDGTTVRFAPGATTSAAAADIVLFAADNPGDAGAAVSVQFGGTGVAMQDGFSIRILDNSGTNDTGIRVWYRKNR